MKTKVEIRKFAVNKEGVINKEDIKLLRLLFPTYKAAQYYVKAAGMALGVISITIEELK